MRFLGGRKQKLIDAFHFQLSYAAWGKWDACRTAGAGGGQLNGHDDAGVARARHSCAGEPTAGASTHCEYSGSHSEHICTRYKQRIGDTRKSGFRVNGRCAIALADLVRVAASF